MSDGIILNSAWSPMQTQICIGAFVAVLAIAFVLWLGECGKNEPLVDFEIKSSTTENGHPVVVVQANNAQEVSRKMGNITYPGGHFVISHTGEKEYTVRGCS